MKQCGKPLYLQYSIWNIILIIFLFPSMHQVSTLLHIATSEACVLAGWCAGRAARNGQAVDTPRYPEDVNNMSYNLKSQRWDSHPHCADSESAASHLFGYHGIFIKTHLTW